MVVLDKLGTVYSCGTFRSSDLGIVGHHWDTETDRIVYYQRSLMAFHNIHSLSDQNAYTKKNAKVLPHIKDIASGGNHFLMLTFDGEIWQMGYTPLGQRTARRQVKRYLLPHTVPKVKGVTSHTKGVAVIKFKQIECGSFHNCAIDTDNALYCWGIFFLSFFFVCVCVVCVYPGNAK